MTSPYEGVEKPRRKIHLIYRDNSLFKYTIPALVNGLSDDVDFEAHTFTAEQTEADISAWLREHASELEGQEILADDTTLYPLRNVVQTPLKVTNLDKIADKASIQALLGNDWSIKGIEGLPTHTEGKDNDIETTKTAFVKIIKKVLEGSESLPETVLVVKKNLSDHIPFKEMREEEIADTLKAWLVEAGLSADIIKFKDELPNRGAELDKLTDNKNLWILGDRHGNQIYPKPKSKVLLLPLASLFLSVKKDIKQAPEIMASLMR